MKKNIKVLRIFLQAALMLALPNLVGASVNTIISDPTNVTECGTLNKSNTVYTLKNDVSSEGSCFAVTASGITLDLNGKKVIYDNGAPVTVLNGSFENDLTGTWDTAGAPNTSRAAGTFVSPVSVYNGSYALKTTVPAADQTITSVGSITLAPNTRYSLSGMVYNQVADGVTMSIELSDLIKATQVGKTDRGFQYISKEFVTGPTTETYKVTIKISGASNVQAGALYVDDIKIQKNRLVGVMVGPVSWRAAEQRRGSDITNFGTANNVIIKNGSIMQGSGASDWSHAVASETNSVTGHLIENLNINTSGANSQAIFFDSMISGEIRFNTLAANMSAITSRDNRHGTVLTASGENSSIHDNTITDGVQIGILSNTTLGKIPNQIFNNNISLHARYTNGFALIGVGSMIRNNTVKCGSEGNYCRGIHVGSGTKVFGNTVDVQELKFNQEYNGCTDFGAYGIQLEKAQNSEIYNNTVTAYAGDCNASALRANPMDGTEAIAPSNNLIHDNIFSAIATGQARAASLKLSGCTNTMFSIYNNTFKTNRRWVYAEFDGLIDGIHLTSNRWETLPNLDNPFYPFENRVYNGSYVKNMVFESNTYGVGDQARFENEYFRSTNSWPNRETNSNFSMVGTVGTTDTTAPAVPQGLSVQ